MKIRRKENLFALCSGKMRRKIETEIWKGFSFSSFESKKIRSSNELSSLIKQ